MDWQQAIDESLEAIARRESGRVAFYRCRDGDCWKLVHGTWQRARKKEIEGFNDWEPLALGFFDAHDAAPP